jgi:uncharacterized protein YidB (DUF937 family)
MTGIGGGQKETLQPQHSAKKEIAMGIFDDVIGKVIGRGSESGAGNQGLLKGVMEMLSDREGGGLSGLVQSFQQKGLGDIISSWIGTGVNLPISPEQIREGMGNERIQKPAGQAGISAEEVSSKLADQLPKVVDKVTPSGVIPESGVPDQGIDFLKGKMP